MKRACRHSDETIFYFDAFDNKYVAKEGTLAWRLNNPGLLLSHSLHRIGYKAIGAYHHYAIFSHPIVGKEAFRAWVISTKYHSPLIEIAKYYQPTNPQKYLEQLCELTAFLPEIKPNALASEDFEKLLRAIQSLAGFSLQNEQQIALLPKITARFYSIKNKVEFYLSGYEDLLTRSQAVKWVETHKLDAVIVHKSNGEVYLRSRPGHHLDQIRFSQKDYGAEIGFKDAVKEVGEKKEGQCIWGFINGIFNNSTRAQESATLVSSIAGGEHVWYLVNEAFFGSSGDAIVQKKGYETEIVKFCVQFFNILTEFSDQSTSVIKPPIVVFAHSQGALIANMALERLSKMIRQRIRVFTLGGAALVSPDSSHPESHNYFSMGDLVPRVTSYGLAQFLLRLHEGAKAGITIPQVIAQMIQDDMDLHMVSQDENAIRIYREERQKYYEDKLHAVRNVTVLDENRSGTWEHGFVTPIYQHVLKEIIQRYQN